VSVRILVGDARTVLATLPAESVHCVVTSPPYWGLRDYGLPPTVWGGDDPSCAHAWEIVSRAGQTGGDGTTSSLNAKYGDDGRFHPDGHQHPQTAAVLTSGFCSHCGAWRGALGLEPTPAAYVAHLVEVFRAVRRVLHPSGTVWCNLGDAYAGSWGAQSRPNGTDIGSALDGGSMLSARQIAAHPKGQSQTGSLKNTPGLKPKDLIGLPWRVAFALQADGWWLRSEIIWAKPNPMPESVTDRPTKAHEQLFLLAKAERYFFDAEAIREPHAPESIERMRMPLTTARDRFDATQLGSSNFTNYNGRETGWGNPAGRSKRSVWTIPSAPFSEAHFATFPPALVEPCVQAGTSERGACPVCGAPWRRAVEHGTPTRIGGNAGVSLAHSTGPMDRGGHGQWDAGHMPMVRPTLTLGWAPTCACAAGEPRPCVVLDPLGGAGTTALVADRLGRDAILVDLSPAYAAMAERRIREEAPLLTAVAVEAASPAASDNGHGRAAPEQLALFEIGAHA
jgi:DNA modification methylase